MCRFGSGNKSPISMLSQYMIGSAASFGFFMCKLFTAAILEQFTKYLNTAIGSVVRSENRLATTPNMHLPVIINQRQMLDNKIKYNKE